MTTDDGLDEAFRTATKLRICAFLSACDEAEFRSVQEYCDLTPAALSKNVSALEGAGYVSVRKGYVGKRPRTWLALTEAGAKALTGHLSTLQKIADDAAAHARRR